MTDYRSDHGGYSHSAASASGTGSALDFRASNGNFLLWFSASAQGAANASGGASATLFLQHSHDLTAWTNIGVVMTASATGAAASTFTASYSAGAYGFVRTFVTAVFSAAQTGTGVIYTYLQPGDN